MFAALCIGLSPTSFVHAKEYHVSVDGSDAAEGTFSKPFRTIAYAARIAQPGDTVTVHEGTYREWINPTRGGTCDTLRIVYRAAEGEQVEIKGSEVVPGKWEQTETKGVWKIGIPNAFFGDHETHRRGILERGGSVRATFIGAGRPCFTRLYAGGSRSGPLCVVLRK